MAPPPTSHQPRSRAIAAATPCSRSPATASCASPGAKSSTTRAAWRRRSRHLRSRTSGRAAVRERTRLTRAQVLEQRCDLGVVGEPERALARLDALGYPLRARDGAGEACPRRRRLRTEPE